MSSVNTMQHNNEALPQSNEPITIRVRDQVRFYLTYFFCLMYGTEHYTLLPYRSCRQYLSYNLSLTLDTTTYQIRCEGVPTCM